MPGPKRRHVKLKDTRLPSMERITEMWEDAHIKRIRIEIEKRRPGLGRAEMEKEVLRVLEHAAAEARKKRAEEKN